MLGKTRKRCVASRAMWTWLLNRLGIKLDVHLTRNYLRDWEGAEGKVRLGKGREGKGKEPREVKVRLEKVREGKGREDCTKGREWRETILREGKGEECAYGREECIQREGIGKEARGCWKGKEKMADCRTEGKTSQREGKGRKYQGGGTQMTRGVSGMDS